MAITAIKGKNCTFTIGSTTYTAWVQSLEVSAEKGSETVSTWGEDVAFVGTPSFSANVSFVFDPSGGLGEAMEVALASETTVSVSLAYGAATRSLASWRVSSYSDSAPADGLVTGQAGLIGSSLWTTTYS